MIKLTPKQEKFCLTFIETGNASESYRQSYSFENMKEATINRNAFELLGHNKISTRLDELNGLNQERHNITIDSLSTKYMALYQFHFKDNPSTAKSALDSLGKLHGILSDHVKHTGDIDHHHKHESISETAHFIREALGNGQQAETTQPLPH